MSWFVVHTKPRQEERAFENLERQGFECYLPWLQVERLRDGGVTLAREALFPRYLFLLADPARSIASVRSTQGVSRLVTFGTEPARVGDELIHTLRARETQAVSPRRLFIVGDPVQVAEGPFAGLQGLYQMAEGERRALVLIELLSKKTLLAVSPASLRKVV